MLADSAVRNNSIFTKDAIPRLHQAISKSVLPCHLQINPNPLFFCLLTYDLSKQQNRQFLISFYWLHPPLHVAKYFLKERYFTEHDFILQARSAWLAVESGYFSDSVDYQKKILLDKMREFGRSNDDA